MASKTLTENYIFSLSKESSIDKVKGIVHGVKINSPVSENGRYYDPQKALKPATPLYEGAKVFINHEDNGSPWSGREVQSVMGRFRGVSFHEDGHRGDFHIRPSWRHMIDDIEHDPTLFGMSHSIDCEVENDPDAQGREVITKINKVHSVDLVATPATTKGMFESRTRKRTEGGDLTVETIAKETHDKVVSMLEGKIKEHEGKVAILTKDLDAEKAAKSALEAAVSDLKKKHEDTSGKLVKLESDVRGTKLEAALAGMPEPTVNVLRESVKTMSLDDALKCIEGVKAVVGAKPQPGKPKSETRSGQEPPASGTKESISDDQFIRAFK